MGRATNAGSGKGVWGQHTKSEKLTTNLEEGGMPSGDSHFEMEGKRGNEWKEVG